MPLAQAEHTSAATVAPADPYAYLPEALAQLEHDGGVEQLLLAVRGYVALGLGDPAGELVERQAALGADPDQIAEVSAAVRGTRSGRLSWEACAGRFRRNLKALVDRDPSLAAIEEALGDVPSQRRAVPHLRRKPPDRQNPAGRRAVLAARVGRP